MSCFVDTSAVVKRYVDEPDAEVVRALTVPIVSQICHVEVSSALWRKHRMGELSIQSTTVLLAAFEDDYFGTDEADPAFLAVAVTPVIIGEAARLCGIHKLRAYDAIQLASALATRFVDPGCRSFAAFDTDLRTAAAKEAFTLVPQVA